MMNALRKRQEKEYLTFSILFNTLKIQYVGNEHKQQLFEAAHNDFKIYYDIVSGNSNEGKTEDKKIEYSDEEIANAAKNIMKMLKK